jgi:hypothetical protein
LRVKPRDFFHPGSPAVPDLLVCGGQFHPTIVPYLGGLSTPSVESHVTGLRACGPRWGLQRQAPDPDPLVTNHKERTGFEVL